MIAITTESNSRKIGKKYRFRRFLDLQRADINCDLHLHTSQTDGKAEIPDILSLAVERHLRCVAFTEHVRQDTNWFSKFAQDVRCYAEVYPQLQVLVGCEAKALDAQGRFDVSAEILAECDLVLGSVHRFPNGEGGYLSLSHLSPEDCATIEFELALGLLRFAPIDVLAHPGGMYSRHHAEFPVELMRELLRVSLEREIAIEINTAYLRHLPNFLNLCAEVNPYVSIGSDMHRLDQLATCRDQLEALGVGIE